MIGEAHKSNFETLERAFLEGDVCLMECTDKETGKPVPVICAVQPSGDEAAPIEFVPFAKLFLGNPYEEVDPPEGTENHGPHEAADSGTD